MATKKNNSDDSSGKSDSVTDNLRQQAKKKLRNLVDVAPESLSSEEILQLVHELQAHQIKLEMQNEKLQQTQSKYFNLYNDAPIGCLTLNSEQLILEANFTAAELLGVAKNALINKPLSQFIVPEDQDSYYLHCQRMLNGKEHDACELRFLRSHRQIYVNLESTMVRDDTGAPLQFNTTFSDITKRKLVEKELQYNQLRLQSIVDTATNAIICIDSRGKVLFFNNAAEAMFGYACKEIIGQNVNKLMPSAYHEEHDGYIAHYLRTRQAKIIGKQREVQGLRKDGSVFPLSISVGVFQQQDQYYFTGIMQDISARKQAEDAIRESEERLSLAMDAIGAGFWDWNILKNEVVHNLKWYQLLGLNENVHSCSPQFYTSLIHEDDRQTVLTKLKHTLETSGRFQSEHRLRHTDGHYIWVQENGTVVKWDKEGKPLRMVGSFIDISERKHQEQQQRKLQHHYERLLNLEVANQTVAAIAHELNQPLNAAASYNDAAQRFLQKEELKEKKLTYALVQSQQQIQRAGQVVHELFNFLHAGEMITMPIDLNKMITDVINVLKEDGHLGKFTTQLDLAPDLPPVQANALQLEKVLINLIRNGIESMNDAGLDQGSIIVTVSTTENDSYALVSISDSGPGFSSKTAQHIFEPFYTTKPDGLGMGLAISRALIEAQGGQLWCQTNEVVEGRTTFHLTIPFAQEAS